MKWARRRTGDDSPRPPGRLRIAYLLTHPDVADGVTRSVLTQAGSLAARHDVRVLGLLRTAEDPHTPPAAGVRVEHLVDLRRRDRPRVEALGLDRAAIGRAHARGSLLVPPRAEPGFTGLTDLALQEALPRLDVDVLVTTSPGLLAAAVRLAPDDVLLVHQVHRYSTEADPGTEALLGAAPQADLLVALTRGVETSLRTTLGDRCPPTVVLPNPLPPRASGATSPLAPLDAPLIVAAGRLGPEKQYLRLVSAFGQVADRLPGWRLRICGEGPQRGALMSQARKLGLVERVELPGVVADMPAQWAAASIAAISSRTEGFALAGQEAMAAGVPVVAFDCPFGPREMIEHDVDGLLVATPSIAGLASALHRLADDPDLRRRLGAAAAGTARAWDAAVVAEQWEQTLHDALDARSDRLAPSAAAAAVPPPEPSPTLDGVTPAQARSAALAGVVDAVRSATDVWLVIPAHDRPAPQVIVPMTERDAVLAALAEADLPSYLSLRDPGEQGWPERRGTVPELATSLRRARTSSMWVEPWPTAAGTASLIGSGCGVELQLWESTADGELRAPRSGGPASRISRTALAAAVPGETEGVAVRSLPWLLAPPATACRFPVDVVYTWVDGNDPAWDASRERRLAAMPADRTAVRSRTSSGRARYLDRGELRYSMRSLDLFAPWVRTIHLVTAGQVPPWLDVDHPRINVVDHRDLLPAEALPTFNSHAIETALHRIEGLSEHFLYLNDDFMVARPTGPERFFNAGGLTAVFASQVPSEADTSLDVPVYLHAAWNNRELLHRAFGAVPTSTIAHAPYAHRVSVLEEVAERFPEALARTASSPFRDETDVSTLSSLAQFYGLLNGSAYRSEADIVFVDVGGVDLEAKLGRATRREQDFLCIGDNHDYALSEGQIATALHTFFEAYFPVVAPWERA